MMMVMMVRITATAFLAEVKGDEHGSAQLLCVP